MKTNLDKYLGSPLGMVEISCIELFALDKNKEYFITHADGNGMINEGIKDRDTLIIEKCECVNDGDTVAAWYDGKAYLKKYKKLSDGAIELAYEDGSTESIIVPHDYKDFYILGRLCVVFRKINYED